MVGALLNILAYDMINVLSSQSREAKTFLLFKSPFVRSKFRISNNLSSFDINPHIYLTDPFTRGVKGEVIPSCLAHQCPWKKSIDTLIFLFAEAIKGRQDLRLTVRCDQLCLLSNQITGLFVINLFRKNQGMSYIFSMELVIKGSQHLRLLLV